MNKNEKVFQAFLIVLLAVICFLILFPLILVISASLSTEANLAQFGYTMLPKEFSLAGYKYVFNNPAAVFNAYKVTFTFSVITTLVGTFLMALVAYPLSKSDLRGKGAISFYLYFTMLFNGGLVPTYILITQYLKLGDTIWVYILPCLISPWYVFMIRTFFKSIPEAICESAYIDGAGEFRVFLTIMLPLSKPVLSTVALFVFLASWNNWYTSMLYINDNSLVSLQYLLQRIMRDIDILQREQGLTQNLINIVDIPAETARMAMAMVVAGPALLVFPFFQKYFVKGLTVGGVKG